VAGVPMAQVKSDQPDIEIIMVGSHTNEDKAKEAVVLVSIC